MTNNGDSGSTSDSGGGVDGSIDDSGDAQTLDAPADGVGEEGDAAGDSALGD